MSALAEKQIIGYLLMDGSRYEETMARLRPDMFSVAICRDIYGIYESCHNENAEVNLVVIQSELEKMEKYTDEQISKCLFSASADLDLGSSYKSCVENVITDYKTRTYESIVRLPMEQGVPVGDAIRSAISELESILDDADSDMRSVSDIVRIHQGEYFKPGVEKKKIFFGLNELDKMVGGIEGGDIAIIAARPSVGKSALALQIIEHNAKRGKRIGYFNLEMKEKQVYERMAAKASGIEMARIRNATRFLNDEQSKFEAGNEKLSKWDNVFVRSGSATLSDLRIGVKNGKFDLVVIDYLQLLKPNKSRGANRYAEVGDISRGVKAIAMDYDIPIIALSQLNRASEGKEDKEPTMSELRESGDIEQDASVIVMLWNSDKEDRTKKKVKVDKARQGKLGSEELTFNGETMTFLSKIDDDHAYITIDDEDNPFT